MHQERRTWYSGRVMLTGFMNVMVLFVLSVLFLSLVISARSQYRTLPYLPSNEEGIVLEWNNNKLIDNTASTVIQSSPVDSNTVHQINPFIG